MTANYLDEIFQICEELAARIRELSASDGEGHHELAAKICDILDEVFDVFESAAPLEYLPGIMRDARMALSDAKSVLEGAS